MRVQVRDAALENDRDQPQRLVDGVGVLVAQAAQLRPHGRHPLGSVAQCGPQLGRANPLVRKVRHRRSHSGQRFVEPPVDRGAEREDLDVEAGRFVREDLVDDERLRETRVALQHVPDSRLSRRHGSTPRTGDRDP